VSVIVISLSAYCARDFPYFPTMQWSFFFFFFFFSFTATSV
jgi:hypothetical protein